MSRFTLARKSLVALVVVVLVLAAGPGLAAAETRFGGTVVVEEGTTVDSLTVLGGTVIVRGTVQGDVSGAAGNVVVDRTGVVGGDVSVATGSLQISGEVRGDVSTGTGAVVVDRTGVVLGEFNVGAGSVTVDGRIAGPAVIGADTITIGSTAVLEQGLRYDAETITIVDGASITGEVVRDETIGGIQIVPAFDPVSDTVVFVYGLVVNLALGAVLLVLFPGGSRRIAEAVGGQPLKSGAYGLAVFVLTPLVIVAAILTIVGIPLAVVGAMLFAFTVWVALVYGRFAVAAWALSRLDVDNRWAALVVGIVGFGLLGLIPFLGGLLDFVVVLLGLGAMALVTVEARRGRKPAVETTERPAEDSGVPPA